MDWARLWWTLGLLVFIALMAVLLWVGWRRRAKRQGDIPELPAVPESVGPDLVEPLDGVYVATTRSGSWQDRIVVHTLGRRAKGSAQVTADGILIDRIGEDPLWFPAASITLVSTAPGIAGKVMGMSEGILVISWRLGNRLLDTGFRAHDLDAQQDWIDAARTLIIPAGDFHDTNDDSPSKTDGASA